MATIIAHSGLKLDLEQKKALKEALEEEISKVYSRYAMYYHESDPLCTVGEADGQITFFVCIPNVSTERKRTCCEALNRAVSRVTGKSGDYQVIVIFKHHDSVEVGVDGHMKCD